jgi:hypothetical protein
MRVAMAWYVGYGLLGLTGGFLAGYGLITLCGHLLRGQQLPAI